jgi:hypothetical protein
LSTALLAWQILWTRRRSAARIDRAPEIAEDPNVKFMLMIYNDSSLLDALPKSELDSRMRSCLAHADELRDDGKLLDAQILAAPAAAKSVRIRNGRQTTVDGPFAETKEMIAGFNVVEASSIDEAVRMAAEFPWARTGCVEVRPIVDWDDVRQAVGAPRRTQL